MSFKSQQQPVVENTRIVDSIGIDNDRAHQSAEFDQMVPVPAIAGQARGFDAEHSSYFSRADLCYETFESGPLNFAGAGTPEVLIDNLNLMKSKLAGVIGQSILPALALQIVNHLTWRGLSNRDNSTALEQFNR